jgi:very-short-patch-repair endonuclease/endogenous inhibitor of DNA gyrase (YacG/DUF329 family)
MNNGTPIECCSAVCAHIKARKHHGERATHCEICGKELTRRQISLRNHYCSRVCNAARLRSWHQMPENKAFMRDHGARLALEGQHAPTSIEIAMMAALDATGIRYVYQFPISNSYGLIFSCDFGFPEARVIVECDGDYWHSLPNVQERDKRKDAYLKAAGYTVLRFSEREIHQDVESCVQAILKLL